MLLFVELLLIFTITLRLVNGVQKDIDKAKEQEKDMNVIEVPLDIQ